MEGYNDLYDRIQDITNDINLFFGLKQIDSNEVIDESSLELIESIKSHSSKLSELSHELLEHLAWDKK